MDRLQQYYTTDGDCKQSQQRKSIELELKNLSLLSRFKRKNGERSGCSLSRNPGDGSLSLWRAERRQLFQGVTNSLGMNIRLQLRDGRRIVQLLGRRGRLKTVGMLALIFATIVTCHLIVSSQVIWPAASMRKTFTRYPLDISEILEFQSTSKIQNRCLRSPYFVSYQIQARNKFCTWKAKFISG